MAIVSVTGAGPDEGLRYIQRALDTMSHWIFVTTTGAADQVMLLAGALSSIDQNAAVGADVMIFGATPEHEGFAVTLVPRHLLTPEAITSGIGKARPINHSRRPLTPDEGVIFLTGPRAELIAWLDRNLRIPSPPSAN